MPTQLLCPQCRVELPGSPARDEPGECPRCKTAFAAPRVKLTKSAAKVLQSKPFTPPTATTPATLPATPPQAAPSSTASPPAATPPPSKIHIRGPIVVTALAAIVVIASIVWVIRMPGPERPASPDSALEPAVPAPVAKSNLPADDAEPTILPGPIALKPNRPKVRPIKAAEPSAPPPVEPGPPRPLALTSPAKQKEIDRAIANGIEFLKKNPHRWQFDDDDRHMIGYASLAALALLEVGVPADEPVVAKAADIVRRSAPKEPDTYELSLAILFLDKLGDPADVPLIRTLGLRLVAGQTSFGGWDYHCPMLTGELEPPFLAVLEALQPMAKLATPFPREVGKGLLDLPTPIAGPQRVVVLKTKSAEPHLPMPLLPDAARTEKLAKTLPEALRDLPIVRPPEPYTTQPKTRSDRDDNSNTQFALLALWAARRHGVPVERSLLLADRRFAHTQLEGGGWAYRIWETKARPTMTCVGLLGLALGHGAVLPDSPDKARPARAPGDPAVDRGLAALAASIGGPGDKKEKTNLYLLWSVERVGVLYNLPRIGGKDWYGWGAAQLLRTQRTDGSWPKSEYHGSDVALDTAFALLFLGRSNLVSDLTERLQLHMPIVDPERK